MLVLSTLREDIADAVISSFPEKRILVAGDLMLDEYLIGDVHRISPEAPVPVVDITRRAHVPGGAANVAANISGLGGLAVLIGLVGNDESARWLKEALEEHRVQTSHLVTGADRPTITKTRIVSGQQQIVRMDREARSPIGEDLAARILETFETQIATADACILSDYGKGLLTANLCRKMIERANAHGKPVVVDPKGQDFRKYAGCAVITPNLREAEAAAGLAAQTDDDLETAAERIRSILGGSSAVLITRGGDGMTLFRKDQQGVHTRAIAHEVFDVTGAGDTVGGALTLALAADMPMEQAMLLANLAASVVVEKTGTATLSAEELRGAVHRSAERGGSSGGVDARSYLSVPRQKQIAQ